jgi:hypothetical protein
MCRRRKTLRVAVLLLLILFSYYVESFSSSRVLASPRLLSPQSSYTAAARSARREAGTLNVNTNASIVWVLLGDPHFQPYILTAIEQARFFNSHTAFYVCIDPAFIEPPHCGKFCSWPSELEKLSVTRVHPMELDDDWSRNFARKFVHLWEFELRGRAGRMEPTIRSRSNLNFTLFTTQRLITVHRFMQKFGVDRVVHLENDQMIYGSVQDVVAKPADACGTRLAMTKVGRRFAPAVMYARDAEALQPLLEFMHDTISQGADHAVAVTGENWVSDMALTAAFFKSRAAAGDQHVKAFPMLNHDGSCMSREGGVIFDGAGLGIWCCGGFEQPRRHFWHKLEESEVLYWNANFSWSEDKAHGALRVPTWNNSRVFNLHMHSKQLHLFRSRDANFTQDQLDGSHNA